MMQFHRTDVLEQNKIIMGIPHQFSSPQKPCLYINIDYDVRNDIIIDICDMYTIQSQI